jgi:hypothetical protein
MFHTKSIWRETIRIKEEQRPTSRARSRTSSGPEITCAPSATSSLVRAKLSRSTSGRTRIQRTFAAPPAGRSFPRRKIFSCITSFTSDRKIMFAQSAKSPTSPRVDYRSSPNFTEIALSKIK